jgi:integrase
LASITHRPLIINERPNAGIADPVSTISGRLTDKSIALLPPPAHGNRIFPHGGISGLGVRMTSAGHRGWVLRYRNRDGRDRTCAIGDCADWPMIRLVKQAQKLRMQIDTGADPVSDREQHRTAPSINQLCDRFTAERIPRLRPSTQRDYRTVLANIIRPALGKTKVAALRYGDITKLHGEVATEAPYQTNRVVAVLSKMMSMAVRWEMRPDNPVRGVERAPEFKRQRFLSPAEIARLSDVLEVHPEQTSANAVRLLSLTGARRGEVLGAQWSAFNLETGVWLKPAATTRQRKDHWLPLSAPARTLLAGMRAAADLEDARRVRDGYVSERFLFRSPGKPGRPRTNFKVFWHSVCRKAGIEGVRVHDLRHTHAAILASAGLSLPIIGQLLGHFQSATTYRYARLLDDPLRLATERAGAIISGKTQT